MNSIWGGTLKDHFVGPAIYADYLPPALADQRHRPPTIPIVIGNGIETITAGFDTLRRGVSSATVVICL